MHKTWATKSMLSLLIVGLMGFIILSGFLVNGQILYTLSYTKQQLDNKADRLAGRTEERIRQISAYAQIVSFNPLIQGGDSREIEDLLARIIDLSFVYDSLLVIAPDGSLIAEAPKGSYNNYRLNCNQLTAAALSKDQISALDIADGTECHAFALVVPVQKSNPQNESRLLVCVLNLQHVAKTMFPENQEDQITIITKNNNEIVLYIPDYQERQYTIPVMVKVMNPIVQKKAPDYLHATVKMHNPEWTLVISKPYESFQANNAQTVYSGIRFCFRLFFPAIIILILLIIVINYSRRLFKEQALKDGLTGLYNYRYLQTELRALIRNAGNRKVSFLMMDLDDFKNYNDTNGHFAGDQILKNVANTILKNTRDKDIAVRYGGEEFALVLPDTGLEEAYKVAERIRNEIKAQGACTVSIGVASFPEYSATAEGLIKSADNALYKAKSISKDRVERAVDRIQEDNT